MPQKRLIITTEKRCPCCDTIKPVSEFHKSRWTLHGYQVNCKSCCYKKHREWRENNLDKIAADQRRRYAKNKDRYKDYTRKQHYGLKPGEYAEMLQKQNGRCAICSSDKQIGKGGLHVDHCHLTSRIRGLLCHNCNLGLGYFKHDSNFLQSAISYLAKS